MQQFHDIDQAHLDGSTILTVGNFDGLHRGHQILLQQLQTLAAESIAQGTGQPVRTGLVTFDPHPLTVLRPQLALSFLTTPQERITLADEQGIDIGVIQTFTPAIAALEALDFLRLLKTHLAMTALVVGPDFALGRNRSGTIDELRRMGDVLDYKLHVIEPVVVSGTQVRSSTVREALQAGDVTMTADLLGRFYTVSGTVVEGDRRGRQIGVPTANLTWPADKLLPANGVYATRTRILAETDLPPYASVTNLGVRPTVDGFHQRLETHLLDFPSTGRRADLYGCSLQVEFIERLRGEVRFPDLDALVTQIHADIAQARQLFHQLAASVPA